VLGPLQNKQQFDIVSRLVEDAKARGARIVTGGEAAQRSASCSTGRRSWRTSTTTPRSCGRSSSAGAARSSASDVDEAFARQRGRCGPRRLGVVERP
jgi:hypothetical protein